MRVSIELAWYLTSHNPKLSGKHELQGTKKLAGDLKDVRTAMFSKAGPSYKILQARKIENLVRGFEENKLSLKM